ncbi:terminase large subunit domain-containing protein [Terriglobus aquaticus]|uniref:Terminase large subunit domain-containing protein n=1 Tax=Terriglobus aquaticus TaxID=940139 RepID=A0ABW9KGM5_9BACT
MSASSRTRREQGSGLPLPLRLRSGRRHLRVAGAHAARGRQLGLADDRSRALAEVHLANVFGWLGKEDGLRRFQKVYISVPRKNAKTTMVACVLLYCLLCDGEHGAQVYDGTNKLEQADAACSRTAWA